ncbi:MAG: hypothetical protein K2H82_09135 [Oscillospiraceae bacterium]|nr:hypothetical protein [Oscillospiraceae bacterium]
MRDYKTVAQRVLQRRDAYVLAQKRKRRMIIKYAAVPACLFLVIGAGVRIWKQTDSGRHILKQNAVEMTEDATTATATSAENPGNSENSENLNSMDSALYETESQDRSDDPTPTQTWEILQATTEPIQTDAESEPGHEAISETRQTEHVITEVIKLESPVMQETKPEQNGVSPANSTDPTEKIPEPTVSIDENTATVSSDPATDPPESNHIPEPTETKQDDPPSVPDETEPKPMESDDWEPSTTAPPQVPNVVPSTTDSGNSYEPSTTATTAFTTSATTSAKKPTNYTITVEEFTPTREQLSNVTQEIVSLEFTENYNSFEQLFKNSQATVRCRVVSVAYTILQDAPYTVYTIEIIDPLCGSFIAGDKLSIVQYGGYLVPENPPVDEVKPPSAQEQTELIEQQIAGSEPPVVSQEYVLFLKPDDVFDGAYETLHENEGMFRYDPKTGKLIRSVVQDAAINSSSYRQLLKAGANFIN